MKGPQLLDEKFRDLILSIINEDISTTSYAELAKWVYKIQEKVRNLLIQSMELKKTVQSRQVGEPQQNREQLIINGVATSKTPPYHYIYKSGMIALANRLAIGESRKGDKSINAIRLENTRLAFATKDFTLARMSNVIDHVYNAINKLSGGEDDGEDDAGAIMFAGMVLAEYYEQQKQRKRIADATAKPNTDSKPL